MQDPELNREVKPALISVFGDVATAIGADFTAYVVGVTTLVAQAAQTQVPVRSGCCEGCSLLSLFACFLFSLSLSLLNLSLLALCATQLDDDDLVDFLYDLRHAIMEAYTGIVQGFAQVPGCGAYLHRGPSSPACWS